MSEATEKTEKKKGPRLNPIAMLILALPALFVGVFSTCPTHTVNPAGSMGIIVSFKKVTDKARGCDERELAEFEAQLAKRLKHMRRANMECGSRERVPLGLAIWIDGEKLKDVNISPSGLSKDSAVYVYEKFVFPAGERKVKIALRSGRNTKEGEFDYEHETVIKGENRSLVVLSFDMEQNVFKTL